MAATHVDSGTIRELSRIVFEYETSEPVDRHPVPDAGDAHFQAHPLVLRLAADFGGDGCAGALAYLSEGGEPEVPALLRWMIAGAYRGRFNNAGDFADAQFRDAVENHYEHWHQARDIGFPSVTLGDIMPWDALGEALAYEEPLRFHMIEADAGVHVFDVAINIDHYRDSEQGR